MSHALILFFWENTVDHRRLEPVFRRSGHEVVATNDPAYFIQCLSLISPDLLMLEISDCDAPAIRLLRAIRAERLSETPAIALAEFDNLELRASLSDLNAAIRLKNKNWIANLDSHLKSRAIATAGPVLQYFPAS